ncbi:Uncharacterised protein [Yersinia enterocolitica]|nr:Uncharacterised protein [Yersinia enterocolitica]
MPWIGKTGADRHGTGLFIDLIIDGFENTTIGILFTVG